MAKQTEEKTTPTPSVKVGEPKIADAVSAKYEMAPGFLPGEYIIKGKKVDFRTISLAAADKLVEEGTNKIRLKTTG